MSRLTLNEIFILFSILLTLASYFSARFLYLKLHKNIFLQPMLVATIILMIVIFMFNIPLTTYQQATIPFTWMIAPLSICLMVPLAENLKEIKTILPNIIFTLLFCGTFTVAITLLIAYALGVSHLSLLSLSSKSVTTAIALVISEEVGALPSLAALIVIITGVIGVITAPIIFKILNIKDERAKGITLGLSAHIIGSAYAMEQTSKENNSSKQNAHNRYASYSIVSMSITALLSALLLPWLLPYFL